jgi:predicted nucleic acid-binding protein
LYFLAGKKGQKVKKIVDSKEKIFTPSIALAEIKIRLARDGIDERQIRDTLEFISLRSIIIDAIKEISLIAAEVKLKFKLYLIDALIYASVLSVKSKLLTADQHFKNLDAVEML